MITHSTFLLSVAMAAIAATAAAAQSSAPQISRQQALDLARKQGMATMYEIELEKGLWEIDGNQADGRRIAVDVDAETGKIVAVDKR